MKRSLALAGAVLVSFCFLDVYAAGVYQVDYRYSFEGMAVDGTRGQAFLICDDACVTGPYLAQATRFPELAVRVSQDIPGRQGTNEQLRGPDGKIAIKQDARGRDNGPGPSLTVLFDLDSATLNDVAMAKLSSFAESAGSRTTGSGFSVTGYTCDLGSKRHNGMLARQRADAVAAWLRRAGMHSSLVKGAGKCCYATQDPHKRYLNRRVEIRISEKEAMQ
ncbi:MAG: putative outer membrane lipoprotein [Syntrophorhabdaceae bacterium PtaU1.Bin034]|nr:MAG: putative outer membrane lipoprotein [Syntrophorhabdaceae bacterium PtaU1.Bin034]